MTGPMPTPQDWAYAIVFVLILGFVLFICWRLFYLWMDLWNNCGEEELKRITAEKQARIDESDTAKEREEIRGSLDEYPLTDKRPVG